MGVLMPSRQPDGGRATAAPGGSIPGPRLGYPLILKAGGCFHLLAGLGVSQNPSDLHVPVY